MSRNMSINLWEKTFDSIRQIMKQNLLIKNTFVEKWKWQNVYGMLCRWCFSCGHQSVEALWLEFREITFYHYNLSISSEMAVHLRNKCFSKLSSYCAFARAMIHIVPRTFFQDYLPFIFHESYIRLFFILSPISFFLRGKSRLFVCMCTRCRILHKPDWHCICAAM